MARPKRPPCCPGCGNTQVENFYVSEKGRRTNAYCKACHKQRCSARYHSKSLLERRASRAVAYGITPENFMEMYDSQGGRCAICSELPTTARGLHVDHCHTTKQVRGLLCHGCNTGIGAMRENAGTLRKAISYLEG